MLDDTENEEEILHLGEIQGEGNCWTTQLGVNGHNTCFKLDTGAAVTVIGDNVPWLKHQVLTISKQALRGRGGIRIPVIGMFQANLKYRQRKVTEPVYVIPNQESALLSRKACVKLGLITRIDQQIEEVISTPADFKAEFPSLFGGLGNHAT